MKRIMTALILAGILTVSTQVFAEPVKAKDAKWAITADNSKTVDLESVPHHPMQDILVTASEKNNTEKQSKRREPTSVMTLSVSSKETEAAEKRGKELLEEYDVQYNQTIRFPGEEHVFQTHGAYALTSIEEARNKYPDWLIPERLGSYQFVDLTLYRDRTSVVFPNVVPPPKDEIEVLTDREPLQYNLCYKKGDSQFRIDVMPVTEENLKSGDTEVPFTMAEWPSHPRGYFEQDEDNSKLFRSLWISPEMDNKYAFLVHKIAGPDCMESEDIPFTEKEADELYQSILKEFPN